MDETEPRLIGTGGKAIPMNLLSPLGSRAKTLRKRVVYFGLHLPGVSGYVRPLLNLSFVQFARWVIIPRGKFPRLDESQPAEKLEHDYLLFNSNYNGQWDQYLDSFSAVFDWGLDAMWANSIHWVPGRYVQGLKKFATWSQIRRGNVPTDYYYCAYPEASLTEIRAALELRDTLAAFEASSDEDPAAFLGRWRELLYSAQNCLAGSGSAPVDGDLVASLDPDAGNLSLGYPDERPEHFQHQEAESGPAPHLFDISSPGFVSWNNQLGQAYGLTLLTPILPGAEHVAAIRAALAKMPSVEESPFHRTLATHTARWVIIDGLPGENEGTSLDTLKSKYLLFDSNFDTDENGLEGYLKALSRELKDEIEAIYAHCVAFGGRAEDFPSYARRCQIDTTFYFADYSDTKRGSVENVIKALDIQRRFVALVIRIQGIERPLRPARPPVDAAAQIQRAFLDFKAEIGR